MATKLYGPVYPKRAQSVRVMLVGSCPSPYDHEHGEWFARTEGNIVALVAEHAGLSLPDLAKTAVFSSPSGRESDQHRAFFIGRREAKYQGIDICSHRSPFKGHYYLKTAFEPELFRLQAEIRQFDPHVVIAFGAVASWALTGEYIFAEAYGSVQACELAPERVVIPTYDPAYLLHHPLAYRQAVLHARLALSLACSARVSLGTVSA